MCKKERYLILYRIGSNVGSCHILLCVVYSAHSHNLSPVEEVSSDISWIKPANAAMMNLFVCLLYIVVHMQLYRVLHAAAVQGNIQNKS